MTLQPSTQRRILAIGILLIVLGVGAFLSSGVVNQRSQDAFRVCSELADYGQETMERCQELAKVVLQTGFDDLSNFLALFKKDQSFEVGDCHIFAHSMGRALYLKEGERIFTANALLEELPVNAALCAIKAYHGFFYEMTGGDQVSRAEEINLPEHAKELCTRSIARLDSGLFRDEARRHCSLGIGYGMAAHVAAAFPGNERRVVEESLEFCQRAVGEDICALGVYEAISLMYNGVIPGRALSLDKEDPFAICRIGTNEEYTKQCAIQLRSSIVNYLQGDLQPVGIFLEGFSPAARAAAMESLAIGTASYFIVEGERDMERVVAACDSVPEDVRLDCIGGMVWSYARVEETRPDALRMCALKRLDNSARDRCYRSMFESWIHNYSREETVSLCRLPQGHERQDECLERLDSVGKKNDEMSAS